MRFRFSVQAVLVLVVFLLPLSVSAHAMPVSYVPASGSVTEALPETLSITFSEQLDIEASSLHVKGPSGTERATGDPVLVSGDAKTMQVPVLADGSGTYIVSWSVVSADDGHFTKGSYAFGVGEGTVVAQTNATSEVVKIATVPEALAMTVELGGNGMIWAALFVLIFAIRPRAIWDKYVKEKRLLERLLCGFFIAGIVAAFVGQGLQLFLKSKELAELQGVSWYPAFMSYLQTAAGEATIGRILTIVAVLLLAVFGRRAILRASQVTWWEWGMIASMLIFAFLRAKISHATANPFHPHFSVFMNMIHLVEKDVLFGFTFFLVLLVLLPRLRTVLYELLPRVHTMLVVDLALVSVTASYIVWLHLKTFDNLFTTEWGSAFLVLLIYAVLLVGVRTYHVLARVYASTFFARFLTATLAVELACAMLVIYASSVVIITSPPLALAHGTVFTAHDQGATITLVREGTEDSAIHLDVAGKPESPVPFLTVTDTGSGGGAIAIPLRTRYDGGYAFPAVLMGGAGPYTVSITAPQNGGYDARATFTVTKEDLVLAQDPGKHRTIDVFTVVMVLLALAALVYMYVLWRYSHRLVTLPAVPVRMVPTYFIVVPVFLVAAYAGVGITNALQAHGVLNPFKARCEYDGNMWHAMLPTRAGVPVAQVPQEGCMWGMGDYPYLFTDAREYDHVSTLGTTTVALTPTTGIVAGVPTTLTARLTDVEGNPALLYIDMEKILHMVIISEDQQEFAHIHPDDFAPLTEEHIRTSTFTFRHTFPKAGTYIIALDYAHGITLGSTQFVVDVAGAPQESLAPATYPSRGTFGGYDVSLSYGIPKAGEAALLTYEFTKDGKPVTTLEPYLSAAMHIAVVKNDLSSFVHTHGEIHPPGTPYPPVRIKDGKVVHSMASMYTPPQFGPRVEAHLVFPTPGRYTVWGQFKSGGVVVPTAFTVDVE